MRVNRHDNNYNNSKNSQQAFGIYNSYMQRLKMSYADTFFIYDNETGDYAGCVFDLDDIEYYLTDHHSDDPDLTARAIRKQCIGEFKGPIAGYYWSYERRNNFFDNKNERGQNRRSKYHELYCYNKLKEQGRLDEAEIWQPDIEEQAELEDDE